MRRLFVFFALCLVLSGFSAHRVSAEEDQTQPAVNLSPLEKIDAMDGELVVIELFSSQACVFCPQADAFMAEFTDKKNIIALSCHIDYFDVRSGSLSLPACSRRQEAYEAALREGPKYTPQMVINGQKNVVGYRYPDVWKALEEAAVQSPKAGAITPAQDGAGYDLALPDLAGGKEAELFLISFDKSKSVQVQDGGNKGKFVTYHNVVSSVKPLGEWSGNIKTIRFDFERKPAHAGITVIAQDKNSAQIIAAAKYIFPPSE